MARRTTLLKSPRIRSGGQTGVDRAALDAAVATGRVYEGWCPKGGWAEDFPHAPGLLTKYFFLKETPSERPEQRTEWNVRDSAATVILVPGANYHSQGTDFTIACAKTYGKPCYIIHYLDDNAILDFYRVVSRFSEEQSINIAGPRESEHPGAYKRCLALLIEVLGLHQ